MSEVKEKEHELKPGEREPEGKDGPKVQYAAGKITELLVGLHPKDRPHVIEGLNKLGVLSGGVSKLEKDQEKEQKERQEETDKWVKEVKAKKPEEHAKEAMKAANEKHQAELDKAKGKSK